MNMPRAAHALGFGARWLTECPAHDDDVAEALGVGKRRRIASFIFTGATTESPRNRRRPELADIVIEWKSPRRN